MGPMIVLRALVLIICANEVFAGGRNLIDNGNKTLTICTSEYVPVSAKNFLDSRATRHSFILIPLADGDLF